VQWDWQRKPLGVLVSYEYIDGGGKLLRSHAPYTMLDSGAYSAYQKGVSVDIDALITEALKPEWTEAVALDVIGDHAASRVNADYMLAHGCGKAMPVFHIGDPWDLLAYYCSRWEKVGLSCRFGEQTKTSLAFYEQCFARAWPHRFHSFGWIDESALVANPFHSADAASWTLGAAYGRASIRNGSKWTQVDVPRGGDGYRAAMLNALERYWSLQQRLTSKWGRQLAQLAS
jgi:hypothetical protein